MSKYEDWPLVQLSRQHLATGGSLPWPISRQSYDAVVLWLAQQGLVEHEDWQYILRGRFAFRTVPLAVMFKLVWGGK